MHANPPARLPVRTHTQAPHHIYLASTSGTGDFSQNDSGALFSAASAGFAFVQQHRGANGAGVASVVVTVVVTPLGDAEVQVVVMVFDMMLFQNENTANFCFFFLQFQDDGRTNN